MSERGAPERALEVLRRFAPAGRLAAEEATTLGDAGFDSLAVAELAAALKEELGADLASVELDASSTVGDVLRAVETSIDLAGPRDLPRGTGRLQGLADAVGGRALGWWVALEVDGARHVPATGPAVLAMNHESALDIPIAVIACPRRIAFMAKRELFKNVLVSRAVRELGGFRVDRDRFDVAAVRTGLAVLRRGGVLGMYPEGTRSPGRLLPFLPGAAWLALRTGAPLVPCAIAGTEDGGRARRPRRLRVRVTFAPPIEVAPIADPGERRSRAEELTARLRTEIASRLPGRDDP